MSEERLKEIIDNENVIFFISDLIDEKNEYKQRIDKAINKIKYIKDLGFDYDGFNNVDDLKKLIDELVRIAEQSIDILRGEDNE